MAIPEAPKLPDPKTTITVPPYYDASVVLEINQRWLAHSEALAAEIERLRGTQGPQTPTSPAPSPTPTSNRFAGDPGPGKAIFGVGPGQDSRANLATLETAVGGKLAYRQYHGGSSDFAVPNGVLAKAVRQDHAEGRIPVISPKPGIDRLAKHEFEKELIAFFKWLEAQPGITYLIVHHEGENDWPNDFNNIAAYKLHQDAYRKAQRWIRQCLTTAAGANPKKIVFIGSLLSYSWSSQGKAKFGDPEGWNPGKRVDGRHIWDVACLDHYLPSYTGTTLENAQWKASVVSIKNWGCLLGITENGVNHGNKNGGRVLAAFIKRLIEDLGCVIYLYFSSSAGPGGKVQPNEADHWTLTDANGSLGAFREAYAKYNYNPNGLPAK